MNLTNVFSLQISGLAVLGGGSMLAGLLPVCLQKKTARLSSGPVLSCLACYGGGVILATCFTHMMPEVNNVKGKPCSQYCQFDLLGSKLFKDQF